METHLVAAAVTVAGTLLVSLLGSFFGSRLARRTNWRDRVTDALPRFYSSAVVAWHAWERHEAPETPEGGPHYEQYLAAYKELLASSTTLALLLPPGPRQKVWDLLDLWEESSRPADPVELNRWHTRVYEVVRLVLDLMGQTAPAYPGPGGGGLVAQGPELRA